MVAPRYHTWPGHGSEAFADEAVEFIRSVSKETPPDDWQEAILRDGLRRDPDTGRWDSMEVGAVIPRQNGKGGVAIYRQLVGLYMLAERLQVYSAHEFATSMEAFQKLQDVIEENDELSREVKQISRAHGSEGIKLRNGARLRFRTRTKGGGRGFSCDCLYLDEAMIISEWMHGALLPTLSARENPQIWYLGSAVDQLVHEYGVVFARVRERGIRGDDPALSYFEWSAPFDHPDKVEDKDSLNTELWQLANPAFGVRISQDFVELEQRSMDPRTFAVERLGVGDWPRTDHRVETIIDLDVWAGLLDEKSKLVDPVSLAYDVSPDHNGSIAAAGRAESGFWHVEIVDDRRGTSWMPERIAEIADRHNAASVVCDGYGPASALIAPLRDLGVQVEALTATDHAKACARFVDFVTEAELRHLGSNELLSAIRSAQTRPLGDAWAWSRKHSTANISPLVSATLAVSAAVENQQGFFVY